MYDFKKNAYVVVEFASLDGLFTDLYDNKTNKKGLNFGCSPLIEIAAVKIEKGKIAEHYTNFIALDGLPAENLSKEGDCDMSYYGITPAHLIGAPSLRRTVERFYYFAKDCIILVRHKSSLYNTPFDIFQWYAKSFGYVLNNPVLSMSDIVQAAKIKELFKCKEKNVDYRDVLKVAANLDQSGFWPDTFADYNIFFNPGSKESFDKGRNDPLSWAIAFAQLFIEIADLENDAKGEAADARSGGVALEAIDDDTCPF